MQDNGNVITVAPNLSKFRYSEQCRFADSF